MIENRRLLIPLGMISLGLSVFLERLGEGVIPRAAFFEGLLLGISIGLSALALILDIIVRHYE
ncbi:MAG: hypothetical protein JSW58_11625 [Candidatus Latescibacterota bacterium]|nr:MAG: hypothetical protein JSW58_11625 [Candidatus Latescibacterota bacterium]